MVFQMLTDASLATVPMRPTRRRAPFFEQLSTGWYATFIPTGIGRRNSPVNSHCCNIVGTERISASTMRILIHNVVTHVETWYDVYGNKDRVDLKLIACKLTGSL